MRIEWKLYCHCQKRSERINPRMPGGGIPRGPGIFPCYFFDDSNRKIRLICY